MFNHETYTKTIAFYFVFKDYCSKILSVFPYIRILTVDTVKKFDNLIKTKQYLETSFLIFYN